MVILQFRMPSDDDYILTQTDFDILPVQSSSSMDIAPGSTLLWMVVIENEARQSVSRARRTIEWGVSASPKLLPVCTRPTRLLQLVVELQCASQVIDRVAMFDLSKAAPDPTYLDLTAVPDPSFQPNAVRVVLATGAVTYLLLGGRGSQEDGLLVYGSVATGSNGFAVKGSLVLPSFGTGITALSQTSKLLDGSVLAATDQGVFKCASVSPG